jgi:hypothetical protein
MKTSAIISCSRRTDIPAFLMNWVIEKIKNGFVEVVNPYNKNQVSRVSLDPNYVKCWVWWSKDFSDWIRYYKKHKDLFTQYKGHSFQFTINSPSELEPNINVSIQKRLDQLNWLVNKFGIIAVNYRFDPIIVYKKMNSNKIKSNLNEFEYIISKVSKLGLNELIFSFATPYTKVERRMQARGYSLIDPPLKKKREILARLLKICRKYNLEMRACCQPDLLNIKGIQQAHCIDAFKIEKVIGERIKKQKDTGQRDACGCYKSKDIGGYHGLFKCKHNCSYCYANPSRK